MIFKRYRFQLVARALFIVASAFLLAYLVGWTGYFYAPLAVGLTLPFQIAGLVRYSEKATRDISHFLESVRQADFSQGIAAGERGPLFEQLSGAYDDVMDEFKHVRAEKEAHLHYAQTVVQHVGIALLSFRADGRVAFVNAAAKRLLGTGHVRNVRDLNALSPNLVVTLLRLQSGEQAVVKVEQDDRDLQLAIYATRFRMREETHVLVSLQDIRSELEEKEMEAWQTLTRVLTHEIMNSAAPIASLAATANTLLGKVPVAPASSPSPEVVAPEVIQDTREALEAIERRSEALMHFVDSYRSFTKIPQPAFEVVAVRPLLAQVQRLLRVQASEQGIDVLVEVEPADLEITADAELIEQVLINLMLNAMDALEGRPDARVRLRAEVDRRARPIVQVIDNGPGIPPELHERIFVPFFTTKPSGSGIGLSLSRQIMRLHGGTLRIRSEPDGETTFTLGF